MRTGGILYFQGFPPISMPSCRLFVA